ncbi:hypothetical protein K470DRAFT_286884 [Piedraia hortae CBS 480.64]|uniref:Uncharacterized protein n=1 Tax=Piedraia hortae CBS 480.64 TaxID=1314780 RepID=A0A6A7BYG6_9PEZI|nr:hypothetical protein K470DRAFT_286884 [Piedraia hortae CBS 480.64]
MPAISVWHGARTTAWTIGAIFLGYLRWFDKKMKFCSWWITFRRIFARSRTSNSATLPCRIKLSFDPQLSPSASINRWIKEQLRPGRPIGDANECPFLCTSSKTCSKWSSILCGLFLKNLSVLLVIGCA